MNPQVKMVEEKNQIKHKKISKKKQNKPQNKHNGMNILDFFGKTVEKPVEDVEVKISLKSQNVNNLKTSANQVKKQVIDNEKAVSLEVIIFLIFSFENYL